MPFLMNDFYSAQQAGAQAQMAQEQAKAYPQLLQQELQLGGLKAKSEELDVQQKQRAINIQENIARMLGSGQPTSAQQATDEVGSLQQSIAQLSKLTSLYDQAGDPVTAEKFRKDLIGAQEHLVTAQERAREHQMNILDDTLANLQLVADDPTKLATARMNIIAKNQLSPEQVQAINNIRSPKDAEDLRVKMMRMKDQIDLKIRQDRAEQEAKRNREMEKYHRESLALRERSSVKADRRDERRDVDEIRRNKNDAEKRLADIRGEMAAIENDTALSKDERKAQKKDLFNEQKELSAEVEDYRNRLKALEPSSGKGKAASTKYTEQNPATPTTQDQFDKLPSGAIYKNPKDGKLYRKK